MSLRFVLSQHVRLCLTVSVRARARVCVNTSCPILHTALNRHELSLSMTLRTTALPLPSGTGADRGAPVFCCFGALVTERDAAPAVSTAEEDVVVVCEGTGGLLLGCVG